MNKKEVGASWKVYKEVVLIFLLWFLVLEKTFLAHQGSLSCAQEMVIVRSDDDDNPFAINTSGILLNKSTNTKRTPSLVYHKTPCIFNSRPHWFIAQKLQKLIRRALMHFLGTCQEYCYRYEKLPWLDKALKVTPCVLMMSIIKKWSFSRFKA